MFKSIRKVYKGIRELYTQANTRSSTKPYWKYTTAQGGLSQLRTRHTRDTKDTRDTWDYTEYMGYMGYIGCMGCMGYMGYMRSMRYMRCCENVEDYKCLGIFGWKRGSKWHRVLQTLILCMRALVNAQKCGV